MPPVPAFQRGSNARSISCASQNGNVPSNLTDSTRDPYCSVAANQSAWKVGTEHMQRHTVHEPQVAAAAVCNDATPGSGEKRPKKKHAQLAARHASNNKTTGTHPEIKEDGLNHRSS
jgi:hypothetical protein